MQKFDLPKHVLRAFLVSGVFQHVPHLMLIREENIPGIMNLDSGWLELHVQMSFKLAQIMYVKSSPTLEDIGCHNYYDCEYALFVVATIPSFFPRS